MVFCFACAELCVRVWELGFRAGFGGGRIGVCLLWRWVCWNG